MYKKKKKCGICNNIKIILNSIYFIIFVSAFHLIFCLKIIIIILLIFKGNLRIIQEYLRLIF